VTTVIYVRQSLDRDGKGAAVDRQLTECRALAKQHKLTVAHEYVDNDVSATKGTRPGFQQLITAITNGQVSSIIVWHTDRLYRRVRDLVELVELAEQHALKIFTVKAGDLDLNNPAGRMLAQMLGAAARYEVEQKGARQIAANVQRANAGHWQFSNRPYGYERVDGKVQIVETEAAIIREAYDRYLAGETYYAIVTDLNDRAVPTIGGKPWTITQLRERLKNPAYAGIRTYKGEVVAVGDWEPVISAETWERFNTTKTRRKTRHDWSNKTKYLLSGLALCGVCGSRMMARPEYQRRKDAPKVTVMTYQCTTGWCVSRNLQRVDEWVETVIIARLNEPDALTLMTPKIDVTPLVTESQELRQRRDDLASLLAEGVLTPGAVRDQNTKLQKRLDSLQEQIVAAEGGSQLSALAMADSVEDHWHNEMTFAQRRAIIAALVGVKIDKQKNTRKFDPRDIVIEWRA
jgi:DNA invertase Pin-like site-specific DNA recombinase